MKKFLLFFVCVVASYSAETQTWTQKASLSAGSRRWTPGFSIGTKGYIGTGANFSSSQFYQDFWEWDQSSNTWSQKASFPGSPREGASGFSIGTKGYIGLGWDGGGFNTSNYRNDFWEWDQTTNTWSKKANFPGTERYVGNAFSIGTKGYMGLGRSSGGIIFNDFYEWDQSNNIWSQKANFTTIRQNAVSFTLGNKGYIGTGYDGSAGYNDFWEFDPVNNRWSQKANYPGSGLHNGAGFSVNGKGYIGTGTNGSNYYSDFWEYNWASNTWTQKTSFGGVARRSSTGFSIGSCGYIAFGFDASAYYNDLWEYCAADGIIESFIINDISIFPNPFSSKINISYSLSNATSICIDIYNYSGEKVAFFDGSRNQSPGHHEYSISLNNLSEGTYFLRISSGEISKTLPIIKLNR